MATLNFSRPIPRPSDFVPPSENRPIPPVPAAGITSGAPGLAQPGAQITESGASGPAQPGAQITESGASGPAQLGGHTAQPGLLDPAQTDGAGTQTHDNIPFTSVPIPTPHVPETVASAPRRFWQVFGLELPEEAPLAQASVQTEGQVSLLRREYFDALKDGDELKKEKLKFLLEQWQKRQETEIKHNEDARKAHADKKFGRNTTNKIAGLSGLLAGGSLVSNVAFYLSNRANAANSATPTTTNPATVTQTVTAYPGSGTTPRFPHPSSPQLTGPSGSTTSRPTQTLPPHLTASEIANLGQPPRPPIQTDANGRISLTHDPSTHAPSTHAPSIPEPSVPDPSIYTGLQPDGTPTHTASTEHTGTPGQSAKTEPPSSGFSTVYH